MQKNLFELRQKDRRSLSQKRRKKSRDVKWGAEKLSSGGRGKREG